MKYVELELPGVLLIAPDVYRDDRGHFLETWHEGRYALPGLTRTFVQDNVSRSRRGVIRGMHYQHPRGQAKLVSVLEGEVFDAVVDIRVGSPAFGKWMECTLSAENARQLYVPEGFAHGFAVLSDLAVFSYKCTEYYAPEAEGTILWCDPDLAIPWPVAEPMLSEKDRQAHRLRDIPRDRLPVFAAGRDQPRNP